MSLPFLLFFFLYENDVTPKTWYLCIFVFFVHTRLCGMNRKEDAAENITVNLSVVFLTKVPVFCAFFLFD